MAKMKELGFGPSLALYHGQKEPWSDHETFWGCSTCNRHDKQCTAFMLSHVTAPFAPQLARLLALVALLTRSTALILSFSHTLVTAAKS